MLPACYPNGYNPGLMCKCMPRVGAKTDQDLGYPWARTVPVKAKCLRVFRNSQPGIRNSFALIDSNGLSRCFKLRGVKRLEPINGIQ